MILKYNRKTELEVVGLGVFKPGEFVITDDESKAKKYLDTGYFDEVKEKEIEIKKRKSKKKGAD
jgi:hypothetical protein